MSPPVHDLKERWPAVVFAVCVVVLLYAMFRHEPPPQVFNHSDKWGHVLGFLALGLTGRWAFRRLSGWLVWPPLLVMAPVLEWLQGKWLPLRTYSAEDAWANVAGVVLAMLLVALYERCRRRR